jgi:hypothetical protein
MRASGQALATRPLWDAKRERTGWPALCVSHRLKSWRPPFEGLATRKGFTAVERVEVALARGVRTEDFLTMHVGVGEGFGGVALAQQRTIVVDDCQAFRPNSPPYLRSAVLG